jgi:ubiquitin-protein ligase
MTGAEYEKDIRKFLDSEDNIYAMEWGRVEGDEIHLILSDSKFTIKVSGPGTFVFSSKDELLGEDFCKQCNVYCKQGKKKITDVLIHATEVYTNIMGDATPAPVDDDIIEDNGGFDFEPIKKPEKNSLYTEMEKLQGKFTIDKSASKQAVDRLMKDYIELCGTEHNEYGFSMTPINNDIFNWEIKFFNFDKTVCPEFIKDLQTYGKSHVGQDWVKLHMRFPKDYPFKPPFIRVISPRFAFRTGRVTVGGSICFELLTGSGWKPINSLEAIFLQIKLEMTNGAPRVDFGNDSEYSEQEARDAFFRVANDHKWNTEGL